MIRLSLKAYSRSLSELLLLVSIYGAIAYASESPAHVLGNFLYIR